MTNAKLILSNKRQINAEHAKAETLLASALEHARRAGALLIETKELLPHGSWGPWLEKHFNGTDRTARLYMQIARQWPDIEAFKTETGVSVLGLRQAIKLLRESNEEDDAPSPASEPLQIPAGPVTTYPQTGDDPRAPVTTTLPLGGATTTSKTTHDPDAWRADTPAPTPPPKPAPPTVEEAKVTGETKRRRGKADDDAPRLFDLDPKGPPRRSSFDMALDAFRRHIVYLLLPTTSLKNKEKEIHALKRALDVLEPFSPSAACIDLPDGFDPAFWEYYVVWRNKQLRADSKPAMTAHSAALLLRHVSELAHGNTDLMQSVLEQQMRRGWKDPYPLKQTTNGDERPDESFAEAFERIYLATGAADAARA